MEETSSQVEVPSFMKHEEVQTTPPVESDPSQEVVSDSSRGGKKQGKLMWVVVGVLVVLFVVLAGLVVYQLVKTSQQEQVGEPAVEITAAPEVKKEKGVVLAYVKNSDVYTYHAGQSKETRATSDAKENAVWYGVPKVLDSERISYMRCERDGDTNQDPYTCSLILHNLASDEKQTLLSNTSSANTNNFQVGAEIRQYGWNSKNTELYYLVDEPNDDGTLENTTVLYRYKVGESEPVLVERFTPTAGRGGSLDDEVYIAYSPNDERVLVVNTVLYPAIDEDEGTAFVYQAVDGERIWDNPGAWTTFGRWVSANEFVAKETINGARQSDLIRVNVATDTIEKPATDIEWLGVQAVTITNLVYYLTEEEAGEGLSVYAYSLDTNEVSEVYDGVIPREVLTNEQILVTTTKPCDECGMDLYNGVETSGLGLLDVEAKTLQNLVTASDVFSFDGYWGE